jgi:hypothetical protein
MSWIQKLFMKILPARWAKDMEAQSRTWIIRCSACGFERSIWDIGGIRWRAYGNSSTFGRCPQCGKRTVHKIFRRQ